MTLYLVWFTMYSTSTETQRNKMYDSDTIEILDNYTEEEIRAEIARWNKALSLKTLWDKFSEERKEEICRKAGWK